MDKKNLEDVNHCESNWLFLLILICSFSDNGDCSYLPEQRAVTSAMVGLVTFDGHKKPTGRKHPRISSWQKPLKRLATWQPLARRQDLLRVNHDIGTDLRWWNGLALIWLDLTDVGGFKHDWMIFLFIYGMWSFPLTNSYFLEGLKPPSSYVNWVVLG